MPFVQIGDISVHYRRSGQRGAPPIVFVNSLGTDLRVWDALLPHLPAGHATLCYDKRGHGLTDATPGPYRMAQLADDLARLLDHLRLREVILCGLSIGGMIAQALAAGHPGRARALVLIGTAARIGAPELWQQRIAAVEQDGIAGIADGVLTRWFTPAFHAKRPAELAGWRNMLTRTPTAGYAGCSAAIRDADLTESTRRLQIPTLCLVGEADGATPPEVVRGLAGLIEGAGFQIIEGAGHLPGVEQPEAVARHLRAFLAEHAPC